MGPPTIIRQSTINNMTNCPASVGYIVRGEQIPLIAEKPFFGTCLHFFAAELMEGSSLLKVINSKHMKASIYKLSMKDGYDWTQFTSALDQRLFLEQLRKAVSTWYRGWYTPNSTKVGSVILAEAELRTELTEEVTLQGTPDLVADYHGNPVVFDWKTTSRMWKDGHEHYQIQVPLYLLLVRENLGLDIHDFCFVVYDRNKDQIHEKWTSRTDEEIDAARLQAITFGLQLRSGYLPTTPVKSEYNLYKRGWYCSPKYCNEWDICEGKYLHDSVDESQERIIQWK